MIVLIVIVVIAVVVIALYMWQSNKKQNALLEKAQQGDAQAQFTVFKIFKEKKAKSSEAIQFLEKSAGNGYLQAQLELARKFRNGYGIEQNPSKAFEWFKKVAGQDSVDAQYNLACCYRLGEGINKDISQALANFQKAADHGHAEAQYELGCCYLRGDGVKEDRDKAIDWCKKAVESGSRYAQAVVGFKRIEGFNELKENYIAIKECCIELVKNDNKLELFSVNSDKFGKRNNQYASISVYDSLEKTIGWMFFQTLTLEITNTNFHHSLDHISHRAKRNHMIYLDRAGIMIKSEVHQSEAPPKWLKICASILARCFTISDPDWVIEYPDAKQYVNSVFR